MKPTTKNRGVDMVEIGGSLLAVCILATLGLAAWVLTALAGGCRNRPFLACLCPLDISALKAHIWLVRLESSP